MSTKKPSSRISNKLGKMPGSLIYVGVERRDPVTIDVLQYSNDQHQEYRAASIDDIVVPADQSHMAWINIEGVHDISIIEGIGQKFGIHPLMLEDIVNTNKRPKFEDMGEYMVTMLKMLYIKPGTDEILAEQVSLVIGKNYVISFQEVEGDVFEPIRDRIRRTIPRQKFLGADYLAHALIDAVVDHYFIVMESIGDKVEAAQDHLIKNPKPDNLNTIYSLKRKLIDLRRCIWPLREVLGAFERCESPLIHDYTRLYMRDLYEHVVQVADTVETNREMVSGLLEIYLTSLSNRTNEIMRLLTVISTIFIPLTFLAGVYGMNFDTNAGPLSMPELGLPLGYIGFWLLSLLIVGGLLWFFKRRKWL
ncbi:MAG: magnesium/cobalt transporter CorA [bacterium]|nr:magnesium/cobalt transporter CorA [bacterium]